MTLATTKKTGTQKSSLASHDFLKDALFSAKQSRLSIIWQQQNSILPVPSHMYLLSAPPQSLGLRTGAGFSTARPLLVRHKTLSTLTPDLSKPQPGQLKLHLLLNSTAVGLHRTLRPGRPGPIPSAASNLLDDLGQVASSLHPFWPSTERQNVFKKSSIEQAS